MSWTVSTINKILADGFGAVISDGDIGMYLFMKHGDKIAVLHYQYYDDDHPVRTEEYNSVEEAVNNKEAERIFKYSDNPNTQLNEKNLLAVCSQVKGDVDYIGKDVTKTSGASFISSDGTIINMREVHDMIAFPAIALSLPLKVAGEACSEGEYWEMFIADYILKNFNWVKMNDGLTDWDNRCYMVIQNNHITQQQFNQIMKWLEFVSKEKQSVEITAGNSPSRVYSLDDPEAIYMKLLKFKNSGQLTEKLHFDPENFDGKIVNGNFGLGSYVTVEINGKQYTRRVYDEPHVDLYIVIDNIKLYYQDFWDNSFNESLKEDFHGELAHEVRHAIENGGSLKLNTPDGFVLFSKPFDSDFGVTPSDVVRVTFFDENGEAADHDVFDSFADATAGFKEADYETLNEDFPDAEHREEHFTKHCVDGDSNEFSRSEYEDEYFYEAAANRLARTRAYTSDLNAPDEVVGFIQRDGAFVKYNKRTSGLVKFKPDRRFGGNVKIITYYKATPQRYKDIYNRKYYKEFT